MFHGIQSQQADGGFIGRWVVELFDSQLAIKQSRTFTQSKSDGSTIF